MTSRIALIFDTETTGLADFNLPPEHETQPDIVQIAMLLCEGVGEGEFRVRRAVSCITAPPYKKTHPKALETHKIGLNEIQKFSIPYREMLDTFIGMVDKAEVLVCHNTAFDARVMRTAWHRDGRGDLREHLVGKRAFCTMKASTPVCRLLGPRAKHRTDWKWPSLAEATEFFFSEKLKGAHDALNDVTATARIFYELERRKGLQEGASSATYAA